MKPTELQLAVQLIAQQVTDTFRPQNYTDTVRQKVREQIQRKVEGQEITEEPVEAPKTQILDLMAALKASLAQGEAGEGKAKRVEKAPAKPARRKVSGG